MKIKYQTVALFLATTVALSSQTTVPASAATKIDSNLLSRGTEKEILRILDETTVKNHVRLVIADKIGWPYACVCFDDTFEILGVDSLTMLEIISDCEELFGIVYDRNTRATIFATYLDMTVGEFGEITYGLF